jgi:DNA-directed RNA polymerase subunit RPC12/RpoP
MSGAGRYKKYKCARCGTHHRGELIARGIYK